MTHALFFQKGRNQNYKILLFLTPEEFSESFHSKKVHEIKDSRFLLGYALQGLNPRYTPEEYPGAFHWVLPSGIIIGSSKVNPMTGGFVPV
jgi:hypothetical protein